MGSAESILIRLLIYGSVLGIASYGLHSALKGLFMFFRFLPIAFIAFAILPAAKQAFGEGVLLSVGDRVKLDLVDQAAVKWFELMSYPYPKHAAEVPGGLGAPLEATVVAIADTEVTIEYYAMVHRKSESPYIITITASALIDKVRGPSLLVIPQPPEPVASIVRRLEALPYLRVASLDEVQFRKWEPIEIDR